MTKNDIQRKLRIITESFSQRIDREIKTVLDEMEKDLDFDDYSSDNYIIPIIIMLAYCNKFTIEHKAHTKEEKSALKNLLNLIT